MQSDTINIGILAHVDAGKTTLSEAILYRTGSIRKLGRVDHGDTFLDTYAVERERGITIFSKQAVFRVGDTRFCFLDTPGHVDFSAEMERTLCVLDYAILVISGVEGIQGHTETVWRLLGQYRSPVLVFVNKMDRDGADRERMMEQLRRKFNENCLCFSEGFAADGEKPPRFSETLAESIAACDEELLDCYLDGGAAAFGEAADPFLGLVKEKIAQRRLYPCFFGSALQGTGIEEFIGGMSALTQTKRYPEEFGGRVYKILHDPQGGRLTFLKVTGGVLRVKDAMDRLRGCGTGEYAEKIDQLRLYSGEKYQTVNEARAGTICAVTGLTNTHPGDGLGADASQGAPVLRPMLMTKLILPGNTDVRAALHSMRVLGEEEPALHVKWDEQLREIQLHIMGTIQIEILREIIRGRFGIEAEFGPCKILYRETIKAPVTGYGHFEPLRHYAEVHLRLSPLPENSGIEAESRCENDTLDRNFQNLILTHIREREHRGILTGSPLTDIKITLIAGRAHIKHTEGGDFREATYRAIRQALEKAENILLEPFYDFTMELPAEQLGRAIADVQRLSGSFNPPEIDGERAVLTGSGPVATLMEYPTELLSYTKGRGRVTFRQKGYAPCHNADEVIAQIGYDKERDIENTSSSVFCSHGAGFPVKWDEAEKYMHILP